MVDPLKTRQTRAARACRRCLRARRTLSGVLRDRLRLDEFERGIETAIATAGLRVRPVDISEFHAVEVDFEDDLERANTVI